MITAPAAALVSSQPSHGSRRSPRTRWRASIKSAAVVSVTAANASDSPSQLQLFVAPWAEFTELGLAVRTEHVLRIDRLAAARAGPQLARRPAWFGQGRGLEFQRAPLRHGQRRPDDHVDEQAEDR